MESYANENDLIRSLISVQLNFPFFIFVDYVPYLTNIYVQLRFTYNYNSPCADVIIMTKSWLFYLFIFQIKFFSSKIPNQETNLKSIMNIIFFFSCILTGAV